MSMTYPNPWDQRFTQAEGFMYGVEPNQWITHALRTVSPAASVLAVADGEGRNSVWLAQQGYQAHNWDYSDVGLAKTALLAQQRQVSVTIHHVDLIHEALPQGRFDAMVSSFFHVPKAHQIETWQRLLSRLTPGGQLVVQVFAEAQLPLTSGGPKSLDLLYDLTTWQRILTGMDVVHCAQETTDLDEGAYHHGEARVININAFKR